jgi:hypothetical protein
MVATPITDGIINAFCNLSETNAMLYDYWFSELYDGEGDLIEEMWNEDTLNAMETDVMYQLQQ